eukprot:TRINITY_DN14115_c0_g1_i1.p1 TRINITY_DN14115_c0_g1~~TRINITY_DN14115_c0_g1_i1.p1  ORF type:complete len:1008 (-),score=233.50 TRINITY_DN14115_c0_g1_i1:95-3070(-)
MASPSAGRWQGMASHTAPLPRAASGQPSPRPKRPRVSFATVSMRTFNSGCEDPQKLSSPQERVLSPLADASMCSEGASGPAKVYNEEDTTQELNFPGIRDLCAATPDHLKGQRNSMSSELGDMQRQVMKQSRLSAEAARGAAGGTAAGSAAAGVPASQEQASDDESDTGEVTANVESLSRLVLEDEQDPRSKMPPLKGPPSQTVRPGRSTPVRTPTTEPETSPLPESWDLYKQFKGSQEALGSSQGSEKASKATAKAAAPAASSFATRSPPPSKRRGQSPDTVDMEAVVKAIKQGPATRSGSFDENESEVPEGRKSFVSAAPQDSVSDIPTPSRGKRQGPYIRATGRVPSASPPPPPTSTAPVGQAASNRSPPRGGRPGKAPQAFTDFASGVQRDTNPRVAEAPRSPPLATQRVGALGRKSLEQERHSTRTSSAGAEADSLLYSPTGESALPGSSALHPITHAGMDGQPDEHVVWEEFLGQCGISFAPIESQPAAGLDAEMPPAAAAPTEGSKRSQSAVLALEQKRAVCLQQAVKELARANESAQRNYTSAVQRWNDAPKMPSGVSELLNLLNTSGDHDAAEAMRSRVKGWQVHCKNEAWLKWYSAKHEWLRKDLEVSRQHTAALKMEVQSIKEASSKVQEISKKAKAMIKHHHHRSDLNGTAERLREAGEDALHQASEEQQLMGRKAPEAREALEAEERSIAELEKRVEEARQAAQQSQLELHKAKRGLLKKQAERVQLQQMRFARTCMITKATAARVELSLRGGATATVARTSLGSGPVRITFQVPSKTSDPLSALAQDLFTATWLAIVAALPEDVARPALEPGAPMEVTVPSGEVPAVVRRMDCGALHVEDQLQSLQKLKSSCSEVTDISARLSMDCGSPMLAVSIALVHSRSHAVSAGPAGVVPLLATAVGAWATQVDATKCIIEFSSALAYFPDSVDWRSATVRQAFGRGQAAEAVRYALHEAQGASLGEAIAAGAQAMRRATSGL